MRISKIPTALPLSASLSFSLFVALLISAANAGPNCAQFNADVIFHCKIQGAGQELTICDMPDGQYLYQYGKPGQSPELEIRSTQEEVVYTPWNGMGSTIWARLGFRNKGYFYDVGRGIQKGGASPPWGFVDIYEPGNDKAIATKDCQTGTVVGDLDGLWDRFD